MPLTELKNIPENEFITIKPEHNVVTFKIQDGPIKDVGHNGCQVDDMINVAHSIIAVFDSKFPCDENKDALDGLMVAMAALDARRVDREARNVEGTNKV